MVRFGRARQRTVVHPVLVGTRPTGGGTWKWSCRPPGSAGRWDGQPATRATADDVARAFADKLESGLRNRPDPVTAAWAARRPDARHGVGIVVERSSVAFRQVEVTPGGVAD